LISRGFALRSSAKTFVSLPGSAWAPCEANCDYSGFEVAVAKDATAAPKHPEWGYGYTAALIKYAFLAHAVLTTDQAIKAMEHDLP
jgi:hypothetical protein